MQDNIENKFDLTKEYGLVLEGGGAKGAYQIGVWKALLEYGIKIKGIAGVSIGALNGALICMDDFELAEEVWKNITYSQVMNVDDTHMEHLVKGNLKEIHMNEIKESVKLITSGGINIDPLKDLIIEVLDEEKVRNSPIEFLIGTISVSDRKELCVNAKETEQGQLKDYLMASSYLPGFKNEKLLGKTYLDGGVLNNVPVDMLIEKGYKDIIVVRIYGLGLEKRVKIPKEVNVIEIAPRINLGKMLEFDGKKAQRNIKVGYYDGLRAIRKLDGKIYYIESKENEFYYLEKLVLIHDSVKMALLEYYKLDFTDMNLYTRMFLENACGGMANELKLGKKWTYKDLYIGMLELSAKYLRIQKYNLYTDSELRELICMKYAQIKKEKDDMPLFVRLILKAVSIS